MTLPNPPPTITTRTLFAAAAEVAAVAIICTGIICWDLRIVVGK